MTDLEKRINTVIKKVIEEMAISYLEKLRELIEKTVYEPSKPRVYQRDGANGGFLDSFTKLPQVKSLTEGFLQNIYFEPNRLAYYRQDVTYRNREGKVTESSFYHHGSETEDYRNKMADILNDPELNQRLSKIGDSDPNIRGGALNVGKRGSYWDAFITHVERNFKKDFIDGARKYGLKLK